MTSSFLAASICTPASYGQEIAVPESQKVQDTWEDVVAFALAYFDYGESSSERSAFHQEQIGFPKFKLISG